MPARVARMGVEREDGERDVNLKVFFAALDLPWDEERSPRVFERAMRELTRRDEHGEGR
jgi:hypothetical protein